MNNKKNTISTDNSGYSPCGLPASDNPIYRAGSLIKISETDADLQKRIEDTVTGGLGYDSTSSHIMRLLKSCNNSDTYEDLKVRLGELELKTTKNPNPALKNAVNAYKNLVNQMAVLSICETLRSMNKAPYEPMNMQDLYANPKYDSLEGPIKSFGAA